MNIKLDKIKHTAIVIQDKDGSDFLRLEANGDATGALADKYPEALPALKEMALRIAEIYNL